MARRRPDNPESQDAAPMHAVADPGDAVRAPLRIRIAFDWDAFVVFLRVFWRVRIVPGVKVGMLVFSALLLGVGMQAAVPPLRGFGHAVLCFPAVVVVYCLVVHGLGWGLSVGLCAGVFQDTLAGTPLGLSSAAYVLGLIAVLVGMRWSWCRNRGGILASVGVTALISVAVPYLVIHVRGDGDLLLGRLAAVSLSSALLAGCLLAPVGVYAGLLAERILGLRRREPVDG